MDNNMSIQTKFNESDAVWVYNSEDGKFYEGKIKEIQSWDKWNGFRYVISHRGAEEKEINAEEKFIYNTKNEILNDCFIEEV